MATIVLTTQNRRHITEHAGRCRHFMVKRTEEGLDADWELRTLPREQTLAAHRAGLPDALKDMDVLVTAGAGPGLQARLAALGVRLIVTDILLPDQAFAAWLDGSLATAATPAAEACGNGPHRCGCHHHHDHGHAADRQPASGSEEN